MKIGHGRCQLEGSSGASLFSNRRHLQVALEKGIVLGRQLFQWYVRVLSYSGRQRPAALTLLILQGVKITQPEALHNNITFFHPSGSNRIFISKFSHNTLMFAFTLNQLAVNQSAAPQCDFNVKESNLRYPLFSALELPHCVSTLGCRTEIIAKQEI